MGVEAPGTVEEMLGASAKAELLTESQTKEAQGKLSLCRVGAKAGQSVAAPSGVTATGIGVEPTTEGEATYIRGHPLMGWGRGRHVQTGQH